MRFDVILKQVTSSHRGQQDVNARSECPNIRRDDPAHASSRPLYQAYIDDLRSIIGTPGEDHLAPVSFSNFTPKPQARSAPTILELGV